MSEWQTIESAPKHGSDILLYEDFEPAVCKGYWADADEEWRPSRGERFWLQPTHWMPLPEPPVTP